MVGSTQITLLQKLTSCAARLFLCAGLAFVWLPLRNALHAEDLPGESIHTVAAMDSLFRTHYDPLNSPGKGTGWKPYNRMAWFYGQRAFPSGSIPAGARMQAWEAKQSARGRRPFDESWSACGPTNLAGRILCLAWNPTNTNVIYAGSASGGLWKTTNGGSNWFAVTDNLPSLAVGAVALDPANPNTIYIGTGEGAFNIDAVYGAGIFKSTDAGGTWNATGMSWLASDGRAVNKIVVSSTNPQMLWCATNTASGGGVFRSTDSGTSWTRTLAGDAKDLLQHPDSAQVLYAALGYAWGSAANGVYKSTDGGQTWALRSSGLPASSTMGNMQICLARSNPQTLYAGISTTISANALLLGIYRTTNGGGTWTLQANTPNMYGSQGWYNLVCEVNPTNPSIVYSAGLDGYRSNNSGLSWTQKTFSGNAPGNSQYAHSDHHALIFKPDDANTIIAATDGGLFKSTNSGDTWTDLNNGLTTFQFYALGNDALNGNTAFGGAQDNGTSKYTGGSSWSNALGGDGGYCNVDFTNSSTVYAEMQYGSHYQSTDGGSNWSPIQNGITGNGAWVTPVVMDPSNHNTLYTATTMVYRSTNAGVSWTAISGSLNGQYISTLAVAPSNPQVICAGTEYNGQVWRTTNGGTNWNNVSTGLPYRYVTRVTVHPTDANIAFAAVSGYGSGHIWKTTNGGSSWTDASGTLPDVPCNVVIVDQNNPSNLYVGTDLGVYASSDGGANWTDFSAGLPNVVVDDLTLHPATGILRAATHGRGLWQAATATPNLMVLSPNGGEVWATGTSQTITWATGGLGGTVSIELNRDYPAGDWEILNAAAANSGSLIWTTYGAATTHARLRITSNIDPSATDESNNDFAITRPQVILAAPNGGETWIAGSTNQITWSLNGASGNVVVQIKRGYPSGSWATLTTSAGTSYTWTVAAPASAACRVRAYLQTDSTIADTSDANFSIVEPSITVTYPNGGEVFTTGSLLTIRWTPQNYDSTYLVEINRSYPSGSWTTIGSAVETDSLTWNVTQTPSSAARIRVTAIAYPTATDLSSGNFTIPTPTLAVTAPNGGEGWAAGTMQTVQWTKSNLSGLVNVYVNRDYPTGNWTPIALDASGTSVAWNVTTPYSNTARIRVASVNVPSYYDESNANFTIGNAIVVTAPDGGESWAQGTTQTIAWTRYNASGAATVEINRNFPGGAWETIQNNVTTNSVSWTVTGPGTNLACVRVRLNSNPAIDDTSNSTFTIPAPLLALSSPNGGDVWPIGGTQTIFWARNGATGNVTVELCRSFPGGAWTPLTTTASGNTFSWTANAPATTSARVRVYVTGTPTIGDSSDANFTIGVPILTLSSPNGGEVWLTGTVQTIQWTRQNAPGNVRVRLNRNYPGGAWETLSSTETANSLAWTVNAPATSNARVSIDFVGISSAADTSASAFSIVVPQITLSSPNGGEVWATNTPQTIRLTRAYAAGAVTVLLNRNYPGGTWETITAADTGSAISWTPTGAASLNCRLRAYLNAMPTVGDTSDGNFSLANSTLTVTSPNGGEQWIIGTPATVSWNRTLADGNATVALNRNYPSGSWETLSTIALGNSLPIAVTSPATTNARVRISLNSNPGIVDESNASFSIVPQALTLSAPDGGENFTLGGPLTVRWTRTGASGAVSVLLNRNYPSGVWETLTSAALADSFLWTASGSASNVCRIKIRLNADTTLMDLSAANLSLVQRTLTLTSHNDGGTYYTGSTSTVSFTRSNATGNVALELCRNFPGGAWETVTNAISGSSYVWTVTTPITTNARLRVKLSAEPYVADTCDANFVIANPSLALSAPNGGASWVMRSRQTITWQRFGVSENVRVELNRNYPSSTWETIATSVGGTSLTWTVSGPTSGSARIRVLSTLNGAIGDSSDTNFAIINPPLVLTKPIAGDTADIGFSYTIRWQRTLAAGEVRVELSRSGLVGQWEFLGNSTDDSLVWNVNGSVTNSARVRISLSANPNVGDTSAVNLVLFNPSLTLTSPAGGENWEISSTHAITWMRQRLPGNVRVEWNSDYPNGSWTVLANGVSGTSYSWTLPTAEYGHARVRLLYESQTQFGDTSGDFAIINPHLTVVAPNGGDTLILGQPYTLRWHRVGTPGAVRVELNRAFPNGAWETLASSVTADTLRWTASGAASSSAQVRITLVSNPAISDISDANSWILPQSLQLIAPVTGDSLGIGLPVTFHWTAVGVSPEAHLYVKRNWPTGSWEPLASNVNGTSWTWTVSGPASETARFRILSAQIPNLGDTTDGAVRIGQPTLMVTSPSSATEFVPGDTVMIAWNQRYCNGDVRVEISRNGTGGPWAEIGVTSGNSLRQPVSSPGSSHVRFRISLAAAGSISAMTSFDCAIVIPTISVTQPTNGLVQALGRDLTIAWTRGFFASPVDVLLQHESGTLDTLRTAAAGDSIHWRATGIATSVNIIVRGRSAPIVEGQSGLFSLVQAHLTLVAPQGGESFVADSIMAIRWSYTAVADPVNIELSRNLGEEWEPLANGVTDTFFIWHVTGPATHAALLRITSVADSTLRSTSSEFEILIPTLSFNALPNTHLIAGSATDVSWTRTAMPGPLELRLSRDNGRTWPEQITTDLTANEYFWMPTAPGADSARLMVRSLMHPQIYSVSEVFDVAVPALWMTTPNAGHELIVGDRFTAAWHRDVFDSPVRVLLRRESGITDTLSAETAADSVDIVVRAPEANSSWIIIEDAATRFPRDSVAVVGPLLPGLSLTTFRNGEPWILGREATVRWSRHYADGNVDVKINRNFPAGTWETIGNTTGDSLSAVITGTPSDSLALVANSTVRPLVTDTVFNVRLVQASITLHPLAQAEYRIGTPLQIAWSRRYANDAVRLELNRQYPSGAWEWLYSGSDSSFEWTAAGDTTSRARLRIVSMTNGQLADTLGIDFSLYEPRLHFDGALRSDYFVGDTLHVRWLADHATPPFALTLQQNANAETLTVTSAQTYDWIVVPPRSNEARLIVSDAHGLADSSALFAIHAPELAFTNPVISGTDTADAILPVTWRWTDGSGVVRLDVSYGGASGNWTTLADSSTDSLLSYLVPPQATDSLLFRITSLRWPQIFAVSAPRSVIVPALHLQMPGSNTWYVGEQKWIHWSRAHVSGDIRVEMTAQERSQPWQPLGVAQADSFLYTVTGPEADMVALRVSSLDRPNVSDTTAQPLQIRRPRITVLEPNGGDTLRVGDQIRLRWSSEGVPGSVGILLWRGDPVNRLDTLFENTANDSSEIWTVTAPIAHQCLLLIASVDNHAILDTSDARFEITGADAADDRRDGLPRDYSFATPYPNPFNAVTQLEFVLPHDGMVRLTIFDVLGRVVETLVNDPQRAGWHRVTWNANRVASGVYFARLASGDFVATRRLLLIK